LRRAVDAVQDHAMEVSAARLDGIPTSAEVLEHGFDFRPSWWQAKLIPEWGSFLDGLAPAAQGRGYHRITRSDVFDRARGFGLDDPVRALVACYVWGVGNNAKSVGRYARVFTRTPADTLRHKLSSAQSLLLDEGPAAAFASLSDGGSNRIAYLGPSFFTKFLYAMSAAAGENQPRALILDRFVAMALNDLDGWTLTEKAIQRPVEDYMRWLKHAHTIASSLTPPGAEPIRADAVEMAYFRHGWRLNQQRRRLAVQTLEQEGNVSRQVTTDSG
jgi:hypothetical protein